MKRMKTIRSESSEDEKPEAKSVTVVAKVTLSKKKDLSFDSESSEDETIREDVSRGVV
jgi:hypothetical protein